MLLERCYFLIDFPLLVFVELVYQERYTQRIFFYTLLVESLYVDFSTFFSHQITVAPKVGIFHEIQSCQVHLFNPCSFKALQYSFIVFISGIGHIAYGSEAVLFYLKRVGGKVQKVIFKTDNFLAHLLFKAIFHTFLQAAQAAEVIDKLRIQEAIINIFPFFFVMTQRVNHLAYLPVPESIALSSVEVIVIKNKTL